MTTLRLSECDIPAGEKIVQAKFEQFPWAWYDAVVTPPDESDPVDFAVPIAMNSRATAGRMKDFMLRKEALDRLLREVPKISGKGSEGSDAMDYLVKSVPGTGFEPVRRFRD